MYFNVGITLANEILLKKVEFGIIGIMEEERDDRHSPHKCLSLQEIQQNQENQILLQEQNFKK